MNRHRPDSVEELIRVLREAGPFRVSGSNSNLSHRPQNTTANELLLDGWTGVVDYAPKDQVISVRAGTAVSEIAAAIESDHFSIPHGVGTIGGSIAMGDGNKPGQNLLNWRDCVLGLRIVLADGRLVRFGSRAVKNVAGYDGHKLFIGSRGTLGVIIEADIRLTPGQSERVNQAPDGIFSLDITDPTVIKYMRRTKDLFDPTRKLNPGEMGIF